MRDSVAYVEDVRRNHEQSACKEHPVPALSCAKNERKEHKGQADVLRPAIEHEKQCRHLRLNILYAQNHGVAAVKAQRLVEPARAEPARKWVAGRSEVVQEVGGRHRQRAGAKAGDPPHANEPALLGQHVQKKEQAKRWHERERCQRPGIEQQSKRKSCKNAEEQRPSVTKRQEEQRGQEVEGAGVM